MYHYWKRIQASLAVIGSEQRRALSIDFKGSSNNLYNAFLLHGLINVCYVCFNLGMI